MDIPCPTCSGPTYAWDNYGGHRCTVCERTYWPAEPLIRRDEADKIATWLEGRACGFDFQWYWADSIRKGEHRIVLAEQDKVAVEASPEPEEEEARGEVGVEGDSAIQQPAAQENDALRPCPFCGETSRLSISSAGYVLCDTYGCGSSVGRVPTIGPGHSWSEPDGARKWNNRPIEDRLRAEGAGMFQQLEFAEARIAYLKSDLDSWKQGREDLATQIASLQQQLAEEQQYAEELERRLRESEGKLCHEMESGGVQYEGGRQEGWKMCRAAVVARIREHAGSWVAGGLVSEVLNDLAREVEEGTTIQQIAGVEYDLAFDRAQLRATVEHETAQKIGKWVADHLLWAPASPVLEAVAEAVASGAWRAEEREGDNWEEVYNVWKEGENWKWARRVVCELIQWSLAMPAVGKRSIVRTQLQLLLENIEKAAEEATGKRGEAHCNQE